MSKNKIVVKQIASHIGRNKNQYKCLKSLGLGKIDRVVEVQDNPSTSGLVNKVKHLVEVVEG